MRFLFIFKNDGIDIPNFINLNRLKAFLIGDRILQITGISPSFYYEFKALLITDAHIDLHNDNLIVYRHHFFEISKDKKEIKISGYFFVKMLGDSLIAFSHLKNYYEIYKPLFNPKEIKNFIFKNKKILIECQNQSLKINLENGSTEISHLDMIEDVKPKLKFKHNFDLFNSIYPIEPYENLLINEGLYEFLNPLVIYQLEDVLGIEVNKFKKTNVKSPLRAFITENFNSFINAFESLNLKHFSFYFIFKPIVIWRSFQAFRILRF